MDALQASSSTSPYSLSTFATNLAASLPGPSDHPETSLELLDTSSERQQMDGSSPSDTTHWAKESSELYYSYRTDLKGDLLRLPLELRDIISDHVLATSEDEDDGGNPFRRGRGRKRLSRLSLVCRNWSHVLRPQLFRRLELRSRHDVHFLDDMLRQPQNGWLSAAVVELWLYPRQEAHIGLERILLALSRKLPSLQKLWHSPS